MKSLATLMRSAGVALAPCWGANETGRPAGKEPGKEAEFTSSAFLVSCAPGFAGAESPAGAARTAAPKASEVINPKNKIGYASAFSREKVAP